MSTTQRSETINSFFDGFVTGGTMLYVFSWQYALACRARLQSENLEDFKNFNETPPLISNHLFEYQVSRVYTTHMLHVFQAEIKNLINIHSTLVSTSRNIAQFSVTELCPTSYSEDGTETLRTGRIHARTVTVDTYFGFYECPCNLFNFKGVICRHALSAYVHLGRTNIPGEYVLSRWCNNLDRTNELDALVPNLDDVDYVGTQQLYTATHAQLLELIQICGTNTDRGNSLKDALDRLKASIPAEFPISDADTSSERDTDKPRQVVKDPKHATSVGRPRNARLKSSFESSSSKHPPQRPPLVSGRRGIRHDVQKSNTKVSGPAINAEIVEEIKIMKDEMVNLLAKHTCQIKTEEDIECSKYFTPDKAVEYGLIDKVKNAKFCFD